ncbi:MAG: tetratricopeptide repeat protein [Bryobacteraceae bacterium]|nr:tetratricopeptide repeat protein [Bryobacteraceae bacterium]
MVRTLRNALILAVLAWTALMAQQDGPAKARQLYEKTRYEEALALLAGLPVENGEVYALMGQCYYMLGDYKRASESLERAVRLEPGNSDYYMWLGRAYGRRAETSSFLTAPGLASKARQSFEKAFQLNPRNLEAVGDLFEYYLEAPSFMGGGLDKARDLAEKTRELDPAEYHYRLARIAEKRKQDKDAEEQLRRAMDLAPRQVGRVLDLARFLAKRGKHQESETLFEQAEKLDPESPKVMFERAKAYIESKRNLDKARELLVRYLNSPLTPDDPPRQEAERLLRQARTG